MSALKLKTLCTLYILIILISVNYKKINHSEVIHKNYSGPAEFQRYHTGIRTADDQEVPEYRTGYKIYELQNAKAMAARFRKGRINNDVIEFTERGPANVPGRTRGIIVDPDDPLKNTWYAGSASGGVWKTTNAGAQWINITPDLSNLGTTVLAMAQSNHNIIYLGTGEGFGGTGAVAGNGIFKSTDRGVSWDLLPSTTAFLDINRIIIDPTNADHVIAATNKGIYKSFDGGSTWIQVFTGIIQDIRATPDNFAVQYAAQRNVGVLKSTNSGDTWSLSNVGMSPQGRVELAISPVNTSKIFASVEGSKSGTNSDLYVSEDGATTWSLINLTFNNAPIDYLGTQGWYDNTLACDPFNENTVYIGGIGLFRTILNAGSTTLPTYTLQNSASNFLSLVSATNFNQGQFQATDLGTVSIEIRFGNGLQQKAHQFWVPEGATSGVPDGNYSYQNYVTVPFEVWDITNDRQLMVSFRDQDRNGKFNLKERNTDGAAIDQSREYVYVHNIRYSETPSPSLAVTGGHAQQLMYNFWPVLTAGFTWDPETTPLPTSTLRVLRTEIEKKNASTITVADVYGSFDGKNRFNSFGIDVHPDQHNIVMIPVDVPGKTYKILVGNDGGLFISNTSAQPGINQGDWTMAGRTYNTTQFYGIDKRPGRDEYFGGTQDNGTWKSPAGITPSATTNYQFNIGGDGFEVLWHPLDDQKLIGGSQFNNFRKSINGGLNWSLATAGFPLINGSPDPQLFPFISKLAHSKNNPDVIFTVSQQGVWKSTDFGSSWVLKPISEKWSSGSFLDVEVSRSNSNIVWAGGAMSTTSSIHVSTNGGETFAATLNYPDVTLGRITKLASHPFEDSTAYALFSFAGKPKVLITKDLGKTWADLSGFGSNNTSSNGFPNVAVYCLYVRTDNPDIIWVGSEIGIVESLDGGATWSLIENFPNVSVWDMKGQDNQIVMATHGRGIWTATLTTNQQVIKEPTIVLSGSSPKKDLKISISFEDNFDSIQFFNGSSLISTLKDISTEDVTITLPGISPGVKSIKMIAYKGSAPFHTKSYPINHLNIRSVENSYATYFSNIDDLFLSGFSKQTTNGSLPNTRQVLHTNHNYGNNASYIAEVLTPIKVSAENSIINYRDIAIVEPGAVGSIFGSPDFKDFVVVEGSKDGLVWIPIENGYDARYNPTWENAFNQSAQGSIDMFVLHEVDLTNKFAIGDTILVRFRLSSDASISSWGWAIDYIAIQQQPTKISEQTNTLKSFLFPNPAVDKVRISYELTLSTPVSFEIKDVFGRTVLHKTTGYLNPGKYEEELYTESLMTGTYFVVLTTSNEKETLRLIKR